MTNIRPNQPKCFTQIPSGAFSNITKPTLTCDHPGPLYASSSQVCATSQRGATLEGLCALPGSPTSPVTRVVDERLNLDDDLMENLEVSALNPCGWDPERESVVYWYSI